MAKIEIIERILLSYEKSYINGKSDTPKTYMAQALNDQCLFPDIKAMGENGPTNKEMLQDLVRVTFYNLCHADQLRDQSVANFLVDWTWCCGANAIKITQHYLNLKEDGDVGPKTLEVINGLNQSEFLRLMKHLRKEYHKKVAEKFPEMAPQLNSWLRRVDSFGYGYVKTINGKTSRFK